MLTVIYAAAVGAKYPGLDLPGEGVPKWALLRGQQARLAALLAAARGCYNGCEQVADQTGRTLGTAPATSGFPMQVLQSGKIG